MGLKGEKWYGTFIDGKSRSHVFWPETMKEKARKGTQFAMAVATNKDSEVRLVELTVTAVYKVKPK